MMINLSNQYDVILDAREDRCPMPLLKAKMALHKMEAGQRLCLLTCDAGALKDIPRYVEMVGFSILATHENDGIYTFIIQKH